LGCSMFHSDAVLIHRRNDFSSKVFLRFPPYGIQLDAEVFRLQLRAMRFIGPRINKVVDRACRATTKASLSWRRLRFAFPY
jgi:hypothetical protein